jgi:hypothetical protein
LSEAAVLPLQGFRKMRSSTRRFADYHLSMLMPFLGTVLAFVAMVGVGFAIAGTAMMMVM